MTVTTTVALPAQPGTGLTKVNPLAGNGYAAPRSEIYCEVDSVSDASGGNNIVNLEFEPNHAHMVHFVAAQITGIAADEWMATDIRLGSGMNIRANAKLELDAGGAVGLYRPPPIFCRSRPLSDSVRPRIQCYVPNVNTETFKITLLAYQFEPEAAQVVFWPSLVANFAS